MKALIIYGTRPEQIKLRSVIKALRERDWTVSTHFTGQSPDLTPGAVAAQSEAKPWPNLASGIATAINDIGQWQKAPHRPDLILVQGDTASAYAGAVAGFLADIPVAHVEAGLRTYRKVPHPEEAFRQAIRPFATYHFAPDNFARDNLLREMNFRLDGAGETGVYVVGNTGIDAIAHEFRFHVLVTLHRRENWGERGRKALSALSAFATAYPETNITVIRHPNWAEWAPEWALGGKSAALTLIDPLPHEEMLSAMRMADLIVTDSGGLQEEAAFLGLDCLVVRDFTEREGLLKRGLVELVTPESLLTVLTGRRERRLSYGRGDSGQQIAEILTERFQEEGKCGTS